VTKPHSGKNPSSAPPSSKYGRPLSIAEARKQARQGRKFPSSRPNSGGSRGKLGPLKLFFLWLRRLSLILLAVLLFFGFKWYLELPPASSLETLGLGQSTTVYARDGSKVGTLGGTLPDGTKLHYPLSSLGEVSPLLAAAVVTNEDRRFYQHHGVDPLGLARSLFKAVTGDRLEGGSTLTNQVMKNTLLTQLKSGRTFERKVKEWMLSVQVERSFSKEEILSNYLNVSYWGDGGSIDIIGAKAASLAYFGKDPKSLTLAQSVYLANLIPSPGRYFNFKGYRPLMRSLLARMLEDGRITKAQMSAALLEKIQPSGWQVSYGPKGQVLSATLVNRDAKHLRPPRRLASHFMQQLERELVARFGAGTVYGNSGLQVYSSLDRQAQDSAERASRNANLPAGATLGATLMDPYSGEVLAMVGQKLEGNRVPLEYNTAAQGRRQVGSSIKPLLFATALEGGLPQNHMELDAPVSYPCTSCPGGSYQPKNFDGTYLNGPVSMRYSLVHSLNLPTLRVAEKVGQPAFEGKLRALNLTPPPNAGLTLALGTLESSPLEMAAAYAPFVNGGEWHAPTYLRKVTDKNGKTLFDSSLRSDGKRVWRGQTAFIATDMLRGVVNDLGGRSLAARAKIWSREVAGKTGTTNDVKDLWFVGFTPEMVGAVWVGKQGGGALPSNLHSGDVSAPIWRDMVAGALEGKPRKSYPRPDRIGYAWLGGRQVAVELAAAPPRARPIPQVQTPQVAPQAVPQATPQPNPQATPQAAPQLEPEVQIPQDDTVVLELDSNTGYRADANTAPQDRIERRVPAADVALYDAPEIPAPLPNAGTDGSSVESPPDSSLDNPLPNQAPSDQPSSEPIPDALPDVPVQEVSPAPDPSSESSPAPDSSDTGDFGSSDASDPNAIPDSLPSP
jgi:penicillin-binding protein 1A